MGAQGGIDLFAILITIHILICFGLIICVLMQSAKGEGLAGAFGGTSLSGAVFGGRGAATFLSKATSFLAIAFMISSLGLAFISPARQAVKQESALKKRLEGVQPPPAGEPSTLPGEQSPPGGDIELPPAPSGGDEPTGE